MRADADRLLAPSFAKVMRKTLQPLLQPIVDLETIGMRVGRVVLLGDAAHPMYPIGSNGASQAILDAECLADSLNTADHVVDALKTYEAVRLPATAKIVLQNRQMGPEQVMQIVEDRAPNGFEKLDDVISREELEAIANRYKTIAGFDRESLNQKN